MTRQGIEERVFGEGDENQPKLVVRLTSSTYFTARGVSYRKDITVLKRKSSLHLSEVFDEPDEMFRITNLDKCEDGIYEIGWCNVSTDWETGYADDWDYVLMPYVGENND